jgi:hypothetical protein
MVTKDHETAGATDWRDYTPPRGFAPKSEIQKSKSEGKRERPKLEIRKSKSETVLQMCDL